MHGYKGYRIGKDFKSYNSNIYNIDFLVCILSNQPIKRLRSFGPVHEIMIYLSQLYILTLLRPMEFSIKFHTVKSGWSIVYIEGLHIIISKNISL